MRIMSNSYNPPAMLVKTWLYILTSADENEARRHAKKMLNDAFGSVEFAIMYLENHEEKIEGLGVIALTRYKQEAG
jgi:hypothetical protein